MQGKVTLEDHFAIEATLGDSQPFGPHVWPELRHRLLDFHDQRLRLMDASGVEIMVASLNAPAIQAIADSQASRGGRSPRQRYPRGGDRKASRSIRGRRRFADARAGDRDARARTLHQKSRIQRRAGQRLFADQRGEPRAALRSAAISLVLARGRKPRRSVLSASAAALGALAALRRPFMADRTDLDLRSGNVGARSAADRQRAVRRASAAADHSRPPRRGLAVLSLAHRQPEQLDEGAAQIRGAQAGCELFPRQFPSHDVGSFQHACADRRGGRDRGRSG